jgi:DNA polymerase V
LGYFKVESSGSSIGGDGISNNDIITVDRLLDRDDGNITLCLIHDEFTLKRLRVEKDCDWLYIKTLFKANFNRFE